MYYKRTGYPEEGELVLCTVTKIHFHSVFVRLDEYNKNGMIHISEISPGRIRNIHDYVKEGKVVVCVVLRINPEREHIDLSLRRVNDNQRRKKVNTLKQEQKSEKIIEFVADKLKKDKKALYGALSKEILSQYEYIHTYFEDIVEGKAKLSDFPIEKDIAPLLEEAIKQRIKPLEVAIEGHLFMKTYAPDGVDVIKKALLKAKEFDKTMEMKYVGAGKYYMKITAREYKTAERILKKATEAAFAIVNVSEGGESRFERKD